MEQSVTHGTQRDERPPARLGAYVAREAPVCAKHSSSEVAADESGPETSSDWPLAHASGHESGGAASVAERSAVHARVESGRAVRSARPRFAQCSIPAVVRPGRSRNYLPSLTWRLTKP